MSVFDDDVRPRARVKPKTSAENCDVFEPSSYTPDNSKYRADYIRSITAKITAELDASLLALEAPDDDEPSGELVVTGDDPVKHLKFILKYLRGPRGFNGSVDNFVVLTEAEYQRLKVKDPNKFYYTYEDEGGGTDYVEGAVLFTNGSVDEKILHTENNIENHILIL